MPIDNLYNLTANQYETLQRSILWNIALFNYLLLKIFFTHIVILFAAVLTLKQHLKAIHKLASHLHIDLSFDIVK